MTKSEIEKNNHISDLKYFSEFLFMIYENKLKSERNIFKNLHEPNSTLYESGQRMKKEKNNLLNEKNETPKNIDYSEVIIHSLCHSFVYL